MCTQLDDVLHATNAPTLVPVHYTVEHMHQYSHVTHIIYWHSCMVLHCVL